MAAPSSREIDLAVLERRIRVARGREPGDLLLKGGSLVNVFTQRVEPGNVVIADGWIAGVGPYDWPAREVIDVTGQVLIPGLIEAHIHVESTLLWPPALAELLTPHATTALIADPHEIGNVLGIPGLDQLLQASEGMPLDFYFMAPSCVPATSWEHAGAVLGADAVAELLNRPRILGLAEMMDFPAVLRGESAVLRKLLVARERLRPLDGHAPRLMGQDLIAYAAAGIRSDHESSVQEEARHKAGLGMLVQVREGSSARNLDTLLPLLVADQLGEWCLCSDDVHPDDLMARGHIDGLLRRVVAAGVPAPRAVRHATLIPARHYGLHSLGAIAPGYRADFAVVADLCTFSVRIVLKNGQIVARDGVCTASIPSGEFTPENTIHLPDLDESAFTLTVTGGRMPAIGIIPGQIVTERRTVEVAQQAGQWIFDPNRDVMLIASIERHGRHGTVGRGLVQGFGFRAHGAIASSVAHDSHNLIVAGTNPRDMLVGVRSLACSGGGWVVATNGEVRAMLPLPIAGLMTAADPATVCRGLEQLHVVTRSLGCPLPYPFGTLSFLALPVIPELKITDQGLFDVGRQEFVRG